MSWSLVGVRGLIQTRSILWITLSVLNFTQVLQCSCVNYLSCAFLTLQLAKFISTHKKELFKQSLRLKNNSERINNGFLPLNPASGPSLIGLLLSGTMSKLMNPFTMPFAPPHSAVSNFFINQSVNQLRTI